MRPAPLILAARLSALALALLAALAPASGEATEWRRIRVGSEGGHPPFNYLDSMGQLQGFEIDLAKAICERLSAECEFVVQDFAGLLPALVAGRYDVVFSSLSITEQRRRFALFSNKYYDTRAMFVANRAKPIAATDPKSMKGLKIGAKLASTNARLIQELYVPEGAEVRLYVTHDEARLDLSRGRLDVIIGDKTALLDWLEKSPVAQCCQVVGDDIVMPPFLGAGIGAAMRKEDVELKALIDDAILRLRSDGGYQAIARKYFSFDPY
ncbi:transporter substrate-binding domain-containing protein [Chenggangzhangella methanolivorans]|uniref:Transporter substrate-binding domain-containing protein n=1 Tax=Chenggangzhangella methanolivorans TaxID=1437009 RepID=A0A9E6REK2_9HYPH|nr:transporter substrate-binding domain-containing protein [Chenggangzhangella methanolivorans]QZN99466.1 transporter substrate-binding domain-containing protein [Chenggangzhangella methanolivorans]